MAEGLSTIAVINYRANIEDVKRQVVQLQRINSAMAKKLGADFAKGATVVKQELSKISQSVKPIKLASGKETREIRTFTTVVRAANGQLATITQKTAGAGKSMRVLNTTVKSGAAGMRTFGQNLATLAKRAALTIPLWFVLRQGIGSVFRTIREGLTDIVAFDRALQKAKRNLQGTTDSIGKNFATLRSEVIKLSIETGRSVQDITSAFQRFATVGFDFETSMAGAQSATKLSILLFGNVEETANAFARTMRVLVDTTQGAKPASQQLAEIMALTAELWKTNAFELNEMTGALERFAPIAKTAGFSAEESVKIIATLGTAALRGTRGGRLLGTSIARLVTKTDDLAKSLGIKVNPEIDRTYDIFLRTLDVLAKTRREAGKISPEFEKITKSIFGLRSSQAIKGLIALNKELKSNLAIVGDVSKSQSEFEKVNDAIFQLEARVKNLNKEMGRAFASGIVGGSQYNHVLELIIKTQLKLNDGMEKFGAVSRNAIVTGAGGGLIFFHAKLLKLLAFVAANPIILGTIATFTTLNLIEDVIRLRAESDKASKSLANVAISFGKEINKAMMGDLNFDEIDLLIARLETFGATQIGFDTTTFDKTLELLKQIRIVEEKITKEKLEQIDNAEKETILEGKRQKIAKIILAHELAILKTRGASTAELLKADGLIRDQLNIEKSATDQYKDRLAYQRAINDEKELESTLSARTTKLAEIARTEGIDVARKIGAVLAGSFDFDLFERIGGKNLDIFKKEFANIFQEQQDIKFLTGKGFDIPIARQDESIRGDIGRIRVSAASSQVRGEMQIKALEKSMFKTSELTIATVALTQSMTNLSAFFAVGGTVTGQQILSARKLESQKIDINLNISGTKLSLSGTPEEIRAGAQKMAPEIIPIIERAIAHTLNTNNSADISKATDGRINKF